MVNFRKLSSQAGRVRDLIDQQGGTDTVKDKAMRVKDIAMGEGTLSDKAKAAADVAKERPEGAEGGETSGASTATEAQGGSAEKTPKGG